MTKKLPEIELKGRIVVVGIGNKSKGDDAAGLEVVESAHDRVEQKGVLFLDAGTVPEKYTSKIKKFEPDHILLIDSVDIGEDPGTVSIVDPNAIVDEKVSSHRLPLSMLINYLEKETGGKVTLVGIQPQQLEMGSEISESVQETVEDLVGILEEKLE